MKYLFVSCSLHDTAGLAMIKGAMNGISSLDESAQFASLHRPEHNRDGACGQFEEPHQNKEAFLWADVICDVGGLCSSQKNKYDWLRLRESLNKPYVWMNQSFLTVDRQLLEGTVVVCRGNRSADLIRKKIGTEPLIAPDLSFLVDPIPWEGKKYRRLFTTDMTKDFSAMFELCDKKTDLQLIEKPGDYKPNSPYEPRLPLDSFTGVAEENFGLVASVKEVHTARYQIACAAILAGIKPTLYIKKDDAAYNLKYLDLMDYWGLSAKDLQTQAMTGCIAAYKGAHSDG
jgi:hypothetical protein